MATSGSFNTGTVGSFYFTFEWYRTGYNSSSNEHYIHYTLYAHNTAGNYRTVYLKNLWVNGEQKLNESSGIKYYDGNVVTSGDTTVKSHNSAGDGWFGASFEAGVGITPGSNCSGEGSWDLDRIPRYTTVSNSERGKTHNSISINWTTTDVRDWTQYSLNGGSWIDAGDIAASDNKSGYYTISNLSPNTKYTIKTRCRRKDSGLWSEASALTITTYDIAKISSLNNFEHGSNPSINITNPASISSLSLVMKVSNTQILSRTVKAGSNTITFSDTELDNLYKKYGSSSSVSATFVLSGGGHTNTKTCTVTLKGNQKTARTNVSASWKRGKVWTNVNGTWKRAVIWTNVSGTWKRGI